MNTNIPAPNKTMLHRSTAEMLNALDHNYHPRMPSTLQKRHDCFMRKGSRPSGAECRLQESQETTNFVSQTMAAGGLQILRRGRQCETPQGLM